MKEFMKAFVSILKTLKIEVEKLMKYFPEIINFVNPIICIYLGKQVYMLRKDMSIGGEFLIPILIFFCALSIAKMNKKVRGIPVRYNERRFTVRHINGNYTINKNEIYEITAYLGELEDYLEANGHITK